MWQQVQNKGLTTKYNEDEYFRLNIKKLTGLAFVPLHQIITCFDLIVNQLDDDTDDLIDYFEKIWVGQPKRRGNIFLHSRVT